MPDMGETGEGANYDSQLQEFSDAMTAQLFRDALVTPINMGVPYLDLEVVTRMFQWNLAELISNCSPEAIQTDDNGDMYVMYNGFRVYAQNAEIVDLEYRVYDLTDSADAAEFTSITSIEPDRLGYEFHEDYLGTSDDERQRVCLVGITYNVPMAYSGITPLQNLFNNTMSTSVRGLGTGLPSRDEIEWNDATEEMQAGGLQGSDVDGLPVPGGLVYYIVR